MTTLVAMVDAEQTALVETVPPVPSELELLSQLRHMVEADPCNAVRLMKRSSSHVVRDYVTAHVEHASWTTARYAKHIMHMRHDMDAQEQWRSCLWCDGYGWIGPYSRVDKHGLPVLIARGAGPCNNCGGKGSTYGLPWIGVNQSFYSISDNSRSKADITITRSWWRLHWIPAASVSLRMLSNGGLPCHHGQSMTILHRLSAETRGQLVCDLRHGSHNCKQLADRISKAPVWSRDKADPVKQRLWTGHLASSPHPGCWCAMCARARLGGTDHEGTCDYCPAFIPDARHG